MYLVSSNYYTEILLGPDHMKRVFLRVCFSRLSIYTLFYQGQAYTPLPPNRKVLISFNHNIYQKGTYYIVSTI